MRQFLFLQGLAGPFFARLARRLAAAGHGVHRVNFNGGDLLFWGLANGVSYRGGSAGWPAFLEALLETRGITDLMLFGDCRPLHRAAVAVAAQRGIAIHVFEEGYIRPDWVTLELGGVNGLSSLSRDPAHYLEAARGLPPVADALAPVASSFARRAFEDVAYNVATMALRPLYWGFRTHRPWHPLVEYAGWLLRLANKPAARRRSAAARARMTGSDQPYFLFPLQLDCDYQIRVHSPFPRMLAAIEHVLTSFASHAPADTLLAVKVHPLDNGLRDWRRATHAVARRLGLSDRVLFLEDGDIALLVRAARGVVTVNSTSGTLALAQGVPVVTLGRAVYDIPRVTHQSGLDAFWTTPEPPEPAVFAALRRVLVHRCLIRGAFFSDQGLRLLVDATMARLTQTASAHPTRAPRAAGHEADGQFGSRRGGRLAAAAEG